MSKSLTHEVLVENLNTKFHVSTDGETLADLDLTQVSELKLSDKQEQFSILFRGPRNPFLGQGMRSLEHEKLGQADLFLVPIGEDADSYFYEAIFNRFLK